MDGALEGQEPVLITLATLLPVPVDRAIPHQLQQGRLFQVTIAMVLSTDLPLRLTVPVVPIAWTFGRLISLTLVTL